MSEQQKPEGSGHSTAQSINGFGTAIGVLYVLHRKSLGHFLEAGYELALGGVITGVLIALYYLFGPRITRWRNRR